MFIWALQGTMAWLPQQCWQATLISPALLLSAVSACVCSSFTIRTTAACPYSTFIMSSCLLRILSTPDCKPPKQGL